MNANTGKRNKEQKNKYKTNNKFTIEMLVVYTFYLKDRNCQISFKSKI